MRPVTHALITGGAGSIGLHLTRRLAADGWRVTLLDSFRRACRDEDLERVLAHAGVDLLHADLAEPGVVAAAGDGYTHVFHLAAMLGVEQVLDHPHEVLRSNAVTTLHALDIAGRQPSLQRCVFASTSEVYAGTLLHFGVELPTPESTPLALPALEQPRTSYMLSKLYGEALCLHSGLPVTIVRPHNVYGPRMGHAHVIPQMLERAHRLTREQNFEVPSAGHTRTFCFVDDAVEMIARLADAPQAVGQAVNVGTQAPEIPMQDLAALVLSVVGRDAAVTPLPPTPGSPARRAPDMRRCAALTGYHSRVELREGIERTYTWYRRRFR